MKINIRSVFEKWKFPIFNYMYFLWITDQNEFNILGIFQDYEHALKEQKKIIETTHLKNVFISSFQKWISFPFTNESKEIETKIENDEIKKMEMEAIQKEINDLEKKCDQIDSNLKSIESASSFL